MCECVVLTYWQLCSLSRPPQTDGAVSLRSQILKLRDAD